MPGSYFFFIFIAALVVCTIVSSLPSARAALYATEPFSASNYTAGQTEWIKWRDDGKRPRLDDMGQFKIDLWIYGRDGDKYVDTLAEDIDPRAKQQDIVFNPSVGSDSSYYYLRFIFEDPSTTAYTSTFTITGMAGSPSTPWKSTSGKIASSSSDSDTTERGSSNAVNSTTDSTTTHVAYMVATTVSAPPLTLARPVASPSAVVTPNVQEEKDKTGLGGPTNDTAAGQSGSRKSSSAGGKSAGAFVVQRPGAGGYGWEKMKFQIVFILWPALMGITMAM